MVNRLGEQWGEGCTNHKSLNGLAIKNIKITCLFMSRSSHAQAKIYGAMDRTVLIAAADSATALN